MINYEPNKCIILLVYIISSASSTIYNIAIRKDDRLLKSLKYIKQTVRILILCNFIRPCMIAEQTAYNVIIIE